MESLPVVPKSRTAPSTLEIPPWIKVRLSQGQNYTELKELMRQETLRRGVPIFTNVGNHGRLPF
jgi:lipoic acid synthetase